MKIEFFQDISPQYSMMLLAEALMQILEIWDQDRSEQLPDWLLQERLSVIVVQIINRTLKGQSLAESEGSNKFQERTAYAILTLKALYSLPWLGSLAKHSHYFIKESQNFLRNFRKGPDKLEHLRI